MTSRIYILRALEITSRAVSQAFNGCAAHASRQMLTLCLKTCSLFVLFTRKKRKHPLRRHRPSFFDDCSGCLRETSRHTENVQEPLCGNPFSLQVCQNSLPPARFTMAALKSGKTCSCQRTCHEFRASGRARMANWQVNRARNTSSLSEGRTTQRFIKISLTEFPNLPISDNAVLYCVCLIIL